MIKSFLFRYTILFLFFFGLFISCSISQEITSARLYIQQEKWEEAKRALEIKLERNPNSAQAWYLKGIVFNEIAEFEEMNDAFDKSLSISNEFKDEIQEVKSNNWETFLKAGIEEYNWQSYRVAIELFKLAVKMKPDNVVAYKNWGFAHLILGEMDKALQPFKEVLEREYDPEIAKYTGQIYFDKGYGIYQEFSTVGNMDARSRSQMQNYVEEAIKYLKISMRYNPEDQETLATLSNAYIILDRHDEANQIFQQGIAADPDNKVYQYNQGVLLLEDDDFEEAIIHFKKAISIDPEYTDARYNLGVAYVNWGVELREKAVIRGEDNTRYLEKFELALPHLEYVANERSGDAELLETLGRLYANLGRTQIAEESFNRADQLRRGERIYADDTHVETEVVKPANLVLSAPDFADSHGDNRLSAGERALISFTIKNRGEGTARDVKVRGKTSASISGLSSNVGDIPPGEVRSISLTAIGNSDIEDGVAHIEIEVTEAGGFDADPIRLTVPTRAFRPPSLVIRDVGVSDDQERGVIIPGEIVEITVRIANEGQGIAEDVVFEVTAGDNVYVQGREKGTYRQHIGTLHSRRYHDITFEAFCNTRADRFPLYVSIDEKEGKYGLRNQDLGLDIHKEQRTIHELIVEAEELTEQADADIPALTISIERDIPLAEEPNPNGIAVIIGNRGYRGDTPDVAFAIRDASLVRKYVEKSLGYSPGNILYRENVTLTDMRVLFGDERSSQGRLNDLVRKGISDVFIFYSGHGAPDPNTRDGYLMPIDADPNRLSLTGYPLEVLYHNLEKLEARSVTVVLDACFSGATGGGEMLIAQASPIGIEIRDPSISIPDGTIITASSGSQIASWHPEKRHGLLTYFFLKGIQGEADYDGDGRITVGELRRYLNDAVNGLPYYARRLHGREQTPQVWGEEGMVIR